ncbi:transcriptional regulator, partial [Pseudoflavonifractor phocaeensis]|nr:transcriptional regulator [Pseudoflavonifractor phocaeensis]
MEGLLNALPWAMGGLTLVLLLSVLRRPLAWLGRLAARTGVGL